MRIAHFSDIHVTLSPMQQGLRTLWGKRSAGALNYYVGGRKRHFEDVEERIERLLEDVDMQMPDHVVCTGDITQMSYEEEFVRCARLFGDRIREPGRYTVIPGNHDRYTEDTATLFDRYFGDLSAGVPETGPRFPFRKDVGSVSLVGLDLARPTTLTDSSGLCGPEQLEALSEILGQLATAGRSTIVLMHYGFYRSNGQPDRPHHGIRDAEALMAVLDDSRYRVDLVLHGHMHRSYVVRTRRRAVICAGSATDLAHGGGYNLYELGEDEVVVHRRNWDPAANAYRAAEQTRVAYRV